MFIRPTLLPEGDGARHLVRDPDTMKHLAVEGEEKVESEYWHSRLLEGGVERCDPPKLAPADEAGEERVEIYADADGVATFEGDHPAQLAIRAEPAPAEETRP